VGYFWDNWASKDDNDFPKNDWHQGLPLVNSSIWNNNTAVLSDVSLWFT
jgi:hypothetical protein